jgi:hypothetical protein
MGSQLDHNQPSSATAEPPLRPQAVPIQRARVLLGDKSRSSIYEAVNEGKLDALKDGARTLITVESIERYMAALPRPARLTRLPATDARMAKRGRRKTNRRHGRA